MAEKETLEAASAAVSGGSNLVTIGKNGRVYPRKFDHEEARALHASGVSIRELSERYGVAWNAVYEIVTPGLREKSMRRSAAWSRENYREPCANGCGSVIWKRGDGQPHMCKACRGLAMQTAAHGTETRYKRCDCVLCRAGSAAARRARRERRSPDAIEADRVRDRERQARNRRRAAA